ncbi:hypothetical protein [Frischella perrara]|uniref:hypothetical protein n=1 Tax=Frischella perrara TaxID=1267021 RepID=UPI0023F0E4CB|nr:hypothetical protein [Frischella perrara]
MSRNVPIYDLAESNVFKKVGGVFFFVSGRRCNCDNSIRIYQGHLRININTDKPDRPKRDLNNLNKAIFKALVHRDVLFDDDQIEIIHGERKEVIKNGKIELAITELKEEPNG